LPIALQAAGMKGNNALAGAKVSFAD